jgi:GTP:adenosylcobinamide-phosphate guanylyltransferase
MLVGLIPARGGSKGLVGKNLLPVAGVPLVVRAVRTCMQICDRTIVTSDDPNIRAAARLAGAEVLGRPVNLAFDEATVDGVAKWVGTLIPPDAWLLVLQPDNPEITPDDLRLLVDTATKNDYAVALGQRRHHLDWGSVWEPPRVRQNRQQMEGTLAEVGCRIWPPGGAGGFVSEIVPLNHAVQDVDTAEDLAVARLRLGRKPVTFRVRVGHDIGSGHIRRAVTLAQELQHHDVRITLVGDDASPWESLVPDRWLCDTVRPGLIVNDTLDTSEHEMLALRDFGPVVGVEDGGPGAPLATLLVNSMYRVGLPNEVSGSRWEVLRPEFLAVPTHRRRVDARCRVLVTFGGTDPARLTERVAQFATTARVIAPPGRPVDGCVSDVSMVEELCAADLVVCSGGRTLFEASRCQVPAIVLAQNPRELTHTHLGEGHGNVPLGLGGLVEDRTVGAAIHRLSADRILRDQLSERTRGEPDGLGARRIARKIDDILEGL